MVRLCEGSNGLNQTGFYAPQCTGKSTRAVEVEVVEKSALIWASGGLSNGARKLAQQKKKKESPNDFIVSSLISLF